MVHVPTEISATHKKHYRTLAVFDNWKTHMDISEIFENRTSDRVVLSWAVVRDFIASVQNVGQTRASVESSMLYRVLMALQEQHEEQRAVVLDANTILIDGRRVEGFTSLQLRLLRFLVERGRATILDLADEVWCDPDTNEKTIRNCVYRTSKKLLLWLRGVL